MVAQFTRLAMLVLSTPLGFPYPLVSNVVVQKTCLVHTTKSPCVVWSSVSVFKNIGATLISISLYITTIGS
jgi:hypothetical protein